MNRVKEEIIDRSEPYQKDGSDRWHIDVTWCCYGREKEETKGYATLEALEQADDNEVGYERLV